MNRFTGWSSPRSWCLAAKASRRRPGPQAPTSERATEALTVERQWLQSWFQGTPVVIAQRVDGGLDIDVPVDFCFEHGRSKVMPALGAVLDKLAESLRRAPRVRVVPLAAPGDGDGASTLATQRADQIAGGLRARGVSAARLAKPTAASLPEARLRLQTPSIWSAEQAVVAPRSRKGAGRQVVVLSRAGSVHPGRMKWQV